MYWGIGNRSRKDRISWPVFPHLPPGRYRRRKAWGKRLARIPNIYLSERYQISVFRPDKKSRAK